MRFAPSLLIAFGMRRRNWKTALLCVSAAAAFSACGGKKAAPGAGAEGIPDAPPTDSQRIESLSATVSRLQSRIEELDARLAAMGDKLESTKLAVDNLAGNKPLKTQMIGASAERPSKGAKGAHPRPPGKPFSAGDGDVDAVASFRHAMTLFKTGKLADAQIAFARFADAYPEHILAGSAQFYAGESYFQLGEYKLATAEYEKTLSSFSSSPRASSAMVRLSQCHESMGNAKEAARLLSLARDLFAGSPSLDLLPPGAKTDPAKQAAAAPPPPAATSSPRSVEKHVTDVASPTKPDVLPAEPMSGEAGAHDEPAH